ncbi:GntR family transcriptional regulator [Euzebya tangerina]|uniref:GntR family transcriptional regulator n=1 Tax=Euzebya tangerina TaxID=591198 RepID=UPI000E31F6D8|nr:GntR family transcriptional regulator [Euzebya tangerina]
MAVTKKDMIARGLRERIANGELKRGTRVLQDELAEEYSTSITPVREALRQLQAEGLLVGTAHRGVRVAEVDLERVKGTYMLRRLVEPYAMQRATMRMTPADLMAAEGILDEMEEADPAADGLRISELNRRFHFLFYERSGPESFVDGIADLWADFPWDLLRVASERVPQSIVEHREMLAAVRAADLDRVAEVTSRHVHNGYVSLLAHLTDGAQPPDDPFELLTD